jgi:hypothetical protein
MRDLQSRLCFTTTGAMMRLKVRGWPFISRDFALPAYLSKRAAYISGLNGSSLTQGHVPAFAGTWIDA